jgi:cell division protein FtsW (lipid II flippase)
MTFGFSDTIVTLMAAGILLNISHDRRRSARREDDPLALFDPPILSTL